MMIKITNYWIVFVTFFLLGCTKDAAEPDYIYIFTQESLYGFANVGNSVSLKIEVTSSDDIAKVEFWRDKDTNPLDIRTYSSTKTAIYTFTYVVKPEDENKKLEFKVIATSVKGTSTDRSYTLSIESATTVDRDRVLRSQRNGIIATAAGSFYASSTKTVSEAHNAVVADVDITYDVLNNVPSLISPSARTKYGLLNSQTGWKASTFAVSSLDFETVTASQLLAAPLPLNETISVVAKGVYIFRNAAGKRGLIKVKELPPNNNIWNMFCDIKVLK